MPLPHPIRKRLFYRNHEEFAPQIGTKDCKSGQLFKPLPYSSNALFPFHIP